MTHQEAIQDLYTIKAYFKENSGGSLPMCLEYAIKFLEKYQWNTGEPQEVNKQYLVQDKDDRQAVGTHTGFGWIFGHYMADPIAWMELPDRYKEKSDD